MSVVSARIRELQQLSRAFSQSQRTHLQEGGGSRRKFLAVTAGLGAASVALAAPKKGVRGPKTSQRTIFFNFSHLSDSGSPYYLMVAGKRYTLHPAQSHAALDQALQTNAFIRSIPRTAITHVAEAVALPNDNITLSYAMTEVNNSTGEYQIPSFHTLLPSSAYQDAFRLTRAGLGASWRLPLSLKRKKYGLPAATTMQDLLDEQALLDTVDFASTLVSLHTELLSADPASAAYIHTNHISSTNNTSTYFLSQVLEDPSVGPASPQVTPGSDNPEGWATLVPYMDDNGRPLKGQSGQNKGLILYDTQWQPNTVGQFVSEAIAFSVGNVKNDPQLGADVTPSATLAATDLKGKVWLRRDGATSIEQTSETVRTSESTSASYTLTNVTLNQNGYSVSTPATSVNGSVTLNFENSYLRWLGLYAQFYNRDKQPIPLSELPKNLNSPLDQGDSYSYLGILTPEFTIYAIPVQDSKVSITFDLPPAALSAKILASGLGYGSSLHPEIEPLGEWLTSIFNLGLPAFMIGIGVAAEFPPIVKKVVIPFITSSASELVPLIFGNPTQDGTSAWRIFVRALLNPTGLIGSFLTSLGEALAAAEITSALIDAIPIVGAILQAFAAAATLAEITETSCEVMLSPKTYVSTLIGQHDLAVTISPETGQQFPLASSYYQLTATFDRGAPFVTRGAAVAGSTDPLKVAFSGVPLGGMVTASVAIYSADGTLVGNGTSLPVMNDLNAAPTITFTQVAIPITANTKYQHSQKTSLNAQGQHLWVCSRAPGGTVESLVCENSPGTLCNLRDITTSSNYIGYVWQSYQTITGAPCQTIGSVDRIANIPNANASNGIAQGGYALLDCALVPGAKLVYDPSMAAATNFYVDPATRLLRQVTLNPPGYPLNPVGSAWGAFSIDSSDLLLHPGGTVVSINTQSSKIETVNLPTGAVTDEQATSTYLAELHCGQGSRPGLLDAPVVGTINSQGTVIVLEAGNNRLHALDVSGNPVKLFTKQTESYFLNFDQTGGQDTEYLDCAVDFSGLIYVLSRTLGNQSVYRLDIYASDQQGTTPISTTMGFNAAKIAVDYWRNVYSLNYEVLEMPDGKLPSVTEPSVSLWLPTLPPSCPSEVNPRPRPPKRRTNVNARTSQRLLRRRDLWNAMPQSRA